MVELFYEGVLGRQKRQSLRNKVTIKETAGKILLYVYQLQRTVPLSMRNRQIGFLDKPDGTIAMTADKKWLTRDLRDINPKAIDTYNAIAFLQEKKFLQLKERVTKGVRIYIDLQLTAAGIDIVEGVERGEDGKHAFTIMFNIPVADDMDIEGLIKESLSKLLAEE